jgi:hypothetical protein
MIRSMTIVAGCVLTGAALELGIGAISGQREAWDTALYWILGLPVAMLVSAIVGWLSRGRQWIWTVVIIPIQVTTMMVRNGEMGGFWPLAVALSALLSAPFVATAAIAAAFRSAKHRASIRPD